MIPAMNATAALSVPLPEVGAIAAPALSGPLAKASVIGLALLAAIVLLAAPPRARALAMLGALVLAPVVLLADIWHSQQLTLVHRHPLLAAAVGAVAVGAAAAVAAVIWRRPWLIGPLVIVALPFRIPVQAGGITSNLLVPLYFVVAAGSLAFVARGLWDGDAAPDRADVGRGGPAAWVARLLALYIVLYAVQATYSVDFQKALQQVVFFYVPFALAYSLLRELEWSRALLRRCLVLVAGLAILFAAIGFVEYATKTIILNPKLVVQNDLHAYFTVNSVFFDPDIFGRFLALVMVSLAAVLIYDRRPRLAVGVTAVLAVLWAGLVLTLSRSSLGALLVGLGTLAALRWRVSRAVWVAVAVVALGGAAVAISPKTFGLNQGLNGASSGRVGLISGGAKMFAQRPAWGYGSGSFVTEYKKQHPLAAQNLAASHTIPITVAAEQGVIGELVYVALVLAALVMLFRRARGDPARVAIAAAFLALVFHTMLLGAFLEDPVTWTLLGIGTALAARRPPSTEPHAGAPEPIAAVA
jgi:putative inorganic carbon (hco3(-)) transporter